MHGAPEAHLSEIFVRVLEAPPAGRPALLQALCGRDDQLARTVAELVAASERAASTQQLMREVLDADVQRLPPGTRIGPYEVRGVIATGGMGIVYLAHDMALDVPVAMKSVRPELAGMGARRLQEEARLAARFSSHPNIATIHAFIEHDGRAYIVSEFVRGRTLRDCLADGPFAPEAAVEAVLAVLAAVGAAHREGVIHRDLKPENVMRTDGGTYKVLDFGIARLEVPDPQHTQTRTGEVAGTPGYMAPEQLRGARADRRADVFAVGVLLYELVTGRHPFARDGALSTWSAVLFDDPLPFAPDEAARLPQELRAAIAGALAKDPRDRWASADAFAGALRGAPRAGSPPLPAGDRVSPARPGQPGRAVAWWQFHEGTAALVYWLLLLPVWHVRSAFEPWDWRWFFFALLATVCVVPSLRFSLWFVSHNHPGRSRPHYERCRPWLRAGDVVFGCTLVAAGLVISGARAGWATLLIAVGVGSIVVAAFVEPLTAETALDVLDAEPADRPRIPV